jgi:hypothetical protein
LNERGGSVGLGVEVELKPLADRLRSVLQHHEKALKNWLERYREFLSPGTYLQEHLSVELDGVVDSLVGNQQLQTALSSAIAATLGLDVEGNLSTLKDSLKTSIAHTLDGIGEVISETASSAAMNVAERIGELVRSN